MPEEVPALDVNYVAQETEDQVQERYSSRAPSTTRSIKRKIDALYDISDELFETLNELLINPLSFIHLVEESDEYHVGSEQAERLAENLKNYASQKKKKKILMRSEKLSDLGIEFHSAISRKQQYDYSDRVNEELGAFTETVMAVDNKIYNNSLDLGTIAILARNPDFTRRLLEEQFEQASFVSYPAYRGQSERTILIVSRKLNLDLDREPLGVLPYRDSIQRGYYKKEDDRVVVIFVLKDGSRRTFVY